MDRNFPRVQQAIEQQKHFPCREFSLLRQDKNENAMNAIADP